MSEYSDIKDFNYNATINKSITIKNGNDLKGATLEVVTDGVTLSGIQKANVTTQSSLKISSSSLSSLSIAAVPSANASQISGRGVSDNMRVNPPTVETDNTTVTSAVTVAIENAQIVAEKLIANEINLAGMNTQLTLKDNVSNISKITTDKVCQVILEKGASSSIPTTKEKINVTGNGELTQIDMTAVSNKKLIAFTPMSGVKSVVKKGSAIDFSDVVMLGTYRSEGSGIKVFRALSEGELIDTFSKLEKDFVVKVGDEETVVFKNGESKNSEFWVGLEAKTYSAYIVSEYQPQDAGCEYQFEITVLDIDGDDDDLPEFELKSIEVNADNVKEHTVGDTLNLRGLVVLGNYEQGKYSYNGIITDYELDPPNGTPLTTAGTQNVTVTAEGKTETIEIIVKEAPKQQVTVTFDMGGVSENQTRTIDQDSTVDAVIPSAKTGYTFDGWYKKIGDKLADASYDFAVPFSEDTTLYAVWTANTYKVTLNNDGSTSTLDVTFDTIVPNIDVPTKTGYDFGGYWTEINGQGEQYIGADGNGIKVWNIADNCTLYAKWTAGNVNYAVKYYFQTTEGDDNYEHKDESNDTKNGITGSQTNVTADEVAGFTALGIEQQTIAADGSTVVEVKYNRKTITYTFDANGGNWNGSTENKLVEGLYGAAVSVPTPTKTGYHCVWNKQVPVTFDATSDTFTAQWTANTYTIAFNSNGGTGDMADMDMTYDVSRDLSANSFSKDGCFLVGWSNNRTDTTAMYMDKQKISNLSETNGATVTLYAIWKQRSTVNIGQIMYSDMTFSSEYVAGKTPIGVVFDVTTDKLTIVNLSESEEKLAWCLQTADGDYCNPATSTSDGSSNWQIICAAVSDEDVAGNYPAFEYVNGLGEGWYLPAIDEFNTVYTNMAGISAALTNLINARVSATPLGTYYYWSSSSGNNKSAWSYMFSAIEQSYLNKTNRVSVRAVRAF